MNQDKQLVEELLQNRAGAFEQLVKTYQTPVYNVCLSLLKDREDAEDLAQEVFIDVLDKVKTFRGESKLSTWLYRITVNKCLEEIRKRRRQKRWAQLTSFWGADGEDLHIAGDFEHPGVIMENKEKAKILFHHIDALPDNQRVAFTLHKVEGLPYTEIAEVMKLSLSAVEALLFRAKKNLQKSLAEFYYENQTAQMQKS